MNSLEHLITRSIRSYYKNRLYAPIIYLVVLIIATFIFPIWSMIFPKTYDANSVNLSAMTEKNEEYAKLKLTNLYFTGYTSKWLDVTRGYYYYTMVGDDCVVVLLDPETCNQGEPTISSLFIKAKVLPESVATRVLLQKLASDLSWSESGIMSSVSSYTISEPDATGFSAFCLAAVYAFTGLFAIINLVIYLLYIAVPKVSPPVMKLSAYGNPFEILKEAEEELATLPQLATEDMFITEHYFIETSNFGIAIVPIDEIIWIYKYSTMHKLFWHHFSITYTLHITAGKRHYIKCPKNIKSDIDGIIDYLAEANHDILVGFSEENRLKVEEIQDDFALVRKMRAFLSKRI